MGLGLFGLRMTENTQPAPESEITSKTVASETAHRKQRNGNQGKPMMKAAKSANSAYEICDCLTKILSSENPKRIAHPPK